MKKSTFITAFGLLVAIGFSSCKKTEVVPTPTIGETFNSLADYFASREVSAESFTMLVQNGATYTTAKGSHLTIPPFAFSHANGTIVTGSVTVRIKEIFSNADMINSRIFPISGNSILNSGGEFFLEATQNGVPLIIADGVLIQMDIPAQAEDPGMMLFFAGPVEDLDSVNWQVADSTFSASGFTFNSADGTYECDLDSIGWANIDAFSSNITYFDCEFQLTGVTGLNASNTSAFAVFKNENAVWPVGDTYWGSIANNTITETHLGAVDLNLIVISVVNGQLYYGLLDVTPAPNQVYQISMSATSSSALDAIINGLP